MMTDTKNGTDLRTQQSAFIRHMVAQGTAWSDLTETERAEAARLGFRVPTFTPCCGQPRPLNWRCL